MRQAKEMFEAVEKGFAPHQRRRRRLRREEEEESSEETFLNNASVMKVFPYCIYLCSFLCLNTL